MMYLQKIKQGEDYYLRTVVKPLGFTIVWEKNLDSNAHSWWDGDDRFARWYKFNEGNIDMSFRKCLTALRGKVADKIKHKETKRKKKRTPIEVINEEKV